MYVVDKFLCANIKVQHKSTKKKSNSRKRKQKNHRKHDGKQRQQKVTTTIIIELCKSFKPCKWPLIYEMYKIVDRV